MSELQVGREMDAEVIRITGIDEYVPLMPGSGRGVRHCAPSENIADAFAALDAVMAKHTGMGFEVVRLVGSQCIECTLTLADGRSFGCECGNRAEAICRAILALAEATDGH